MNLIEEISKAAEAIKSFQDLEMVEQSTEYVNRETGEKLEIPEDANLLDFAVTNQINFSQYEKRIVTNNPKSRLIEMLTGDPDVEITKKDFENLKLLADTLPKLTKRFQFEQKLKNLNQKIFQAKGTAQENELRKERVLLYIDSDIKPRSTFKDLILYLSVLGERKSYETYNAGIIQQ